MNRSTEVALHHLGSLAADAKRDGLGQQILDAIRMDTPDLRDDEDEAPFTVNDIRMDTPDMMGCTDPQAEFVAQGGEQREEG